MPRQRLEDPLPAGDPALLHGDPDLRPGQLDGLIVDGQDAFAARRRMMREKHDGPDPAPPPARVRREQPIIREETPVALNTVPLSQIISGTAETRDAAKRPAPGAVQIITPEDFAALPSRGGQSAHVLSPAVEALARGKCISVAAEPKRVAATRQALRKLAKERGMLLEIRSGPDYVAARMVAPAGKEARPS